MYPGAVNLLCSVLYAHNHLDRHRRRQRAAASASARVLASLAQHLHERVGAAVDDFAVAAEIRSAVHDADYLLRPLYMSHIDTQRETERQRDR